MIACNAIFILGTLSTFEVELKVQNKQWIHFTNPLNRKIKFKEFTVNTSRTFENNYMFRLLTLE